jgi:chloramphenicol 3-O-phosphotransferase
VVDATALSRDGFWYDRTGHDAGGHPIVVIRYGQVGRRMLHSSCDAVATFAHGGDHLVIDEMLLTPDLLPIWIDAPAGLDIRLVCVTCPLSVAERPPASTARGCLSSPWNRVCGDTAPPLRHPMLQSKCG